MVNNGLDIIFVWKAKIIAMDKYRQFILEGVQHQPEIWLHLKGQIYLGDKAFVVEMQKKIGKEKCRLNIPSSKSSRSKPLSEIAAHTKDRKTAIVAAYKTGAYSQREIRKFCQLHPTMIRVSIARPSFVTK